MFWGKIKFEGLFWYNACAVLMSLRGQTVKLKIVISHLLVVIEPRANTECLNKNWHESLWWKGLQIEYSFFLSTGAVYFYDCPREHYIPIYLIVGGSFGILKNLSNVVQRIRNRNNDQDQENAKTNPFDGTLNCFLFAWFIAGEQSTCLL